MRLTADTNVLLRAIVADDPRQAKIAQGALRKAERIAVTTTALCEFVWVASRGYRLSSEKIAIAIRALIGSANVEANRPAVDAGLAILEQGGDFADGVIVFDGKSLGADCFVSFDKDAVKLLKQQGQTTLHLG